MTTPSVSTDETTSSSSRPLCVLGCADRTRTDVWPRPPRAREPGLLTCRKCADRIRLTLTEVLELAVNLELVAAAGSAPRTGDGGRKKIKDEPVAPVPVSIPATALTDVRSSHGTWVPAAPADPPVEFVDDDGTPLTVEQLRAAVDRDDEALTAAVEQFGPRSEEAVMAASWLTFSQARLRAASTPRPAGQRSISPDDGTPASVVGFLDRWTDRVRVGRSLLGAGGCRAVRPIADGPNAGLLEMCSRPTEYRRLVRIEMGARTTGLFAVCPAGHVTRPFGQGDQELRHRGGHGHRATRGARHGRTIFEAVNFLMIHNDWVCSQDWVPDYWRGLRGIRAELGRAHGEQRPAPIGSCPNGTGAVDEHDVELRCGHPLYASAYSDTIECTRCGRTWSHREWRFLGRTLGVIA